MLPEPAQNRDYPELARQIKAWARDLGFSGATIGRAELPAEVGQRLLDWLAAGHHGEMDYMARHGLLRARPAELVPGALSVVSVRLPYRDPAARDMHAVLADGDKAAIARYALGRDYHKTVRNRLQKLADRLHAAAGPLGYRVFSDSAPLMEVALAAQSGLGWRGKHTLLIHRDEGSFFFSANCSPTCPCRPMRQWTRIAGAAPAVWTCVRPRPSSRPTRWTPAAVFLI